MNNITELQIESVKRIKAVTIKPDGSSVVIGGLNAQGKTSVLDSIEMVLGGKKTIPSRPIHNGKDTARIVLKMDGLVVTRTFTKKGSYLKVTTEDGASYPGAQEKLDSLIGRLSLDPLAFTRLDHKKQSETLRSLIGLDLASEDKERSEVYDKRTDAGRLVKSLEARLGSMAYHDDAPDEMVPIEDLTKRLRDASEKNQKIKESIEELQRLNAQSEMLKDQIREAEQALSSVNNRLEICKESHIVLGDPVDVDCIYEDMKHAESANEKVRENQAFAIIKNKLDDESSNYEKMTAKIESIDKTKRDKLANAKYPIDGLGIDDDGVVTYGGIPFDQASGAEKIRVSAAIGLALNPKMGVLLVRDASLLDPESMSALCGYADEMGAQVWLERVGTGEECTVIIEDGMVVGADESEPAECDPVDDEEGELFGEGK